MKIVLAALLLLPILGHADEAVTSLKQLQPGDTIDFPHAIVLQPKHRSDVLETSYYFSKSEHPSCRIEVPDTTNVDQLKLDSLRWKVAENPENHLGLFSEGHVTLVLEDPVSRKRLNLDCDHQVDLDMLQGIDFHVTATRPDKPNRVERRNDDPVEQAPETPTGSGASAQ